MTAAKAEKSKHPMVTFREFMDARAVELINALPEHMTAERFIRVVMTAVGQNTNLLTADRQSLWNSCVKCASDGLLPDNREAALVMFGDKAQYLPMIQGLRKKARNSGEILNWEAHPVYANDSFDYQLGDDPFIKHKPALNEPGQIIAAYSIAWLKDDIISREVMSIGEIEAIRKKSRAQKGPWDDPTFYPEMCRKTVARRHAKSLPLSADVDSLLERDNDLYDFGKPEPRPANVKQITGVAEALDAFGGEEKTEAGAELADEMTGGAE